MNDIVDLKGFKKIAIMGGTFNPIHYGHLVAAEAVRQEMNIEKIIFIPTGRPPHKKNTDDEHAEHRYLMTVLATVTNPHFDVSRMEIERSGLTYTIDTVREIRSLCKPNTSVFFITGADAVNQILTWKDSEALLSLCEFVAVTRPGHKKEKLLESIDSIQNKFKSRLHFLEVPALAISSTDIRNRVMAGKTIKYLLPETVEDYILKFGLYKSPSFYDDDMERINKQLHSILSPERFLHTQGVIQEAEKLAEAYSADKNRAILAALLHDCAKEYPNSEKLNMCKKYHIKIDDVIKHQPDLAHSFLGAEVAHSEYDIKDDEILDAIRYHTTGRKNMSMLEKIIYISDYIEPNRKPFPGIEKARLLAYLDLDKAMYFCLKNTIEYNRQKKRMIHPLSLEALKYYKNKGEQKFE